MKDTTEPRCVPGEPSAQVQDEDVQDIIEADATDASGGARESRVLSYKQLAKEKRKAMYQQAKAQRATDPRHLAQKEAAQKFRREAYQRAKERLKQSAAASKAEAKAAQNAERDARYRARTEGKNRELMKLITWVVKRSDAQND